jgi:hypothetical protein
LDDELARQVAQSARNEQKLFSEIVELSNAGSAMQKYNFSNRGVKRNAPVQS